MTSKEWGTTLRHDRTCTVTALLRRAGEALKSCYVDVDLEGGA